VIETPAQAAGSKPWTEQLGQQNVRDTGETVSREQLTTDLNLRGALAAAAFFLPKRIRRRLRVIGR